MIEDDFSAAFPPCFNCEDACESCKETELCDESDCMSCSFAFLCWQEDMDSKGHEAATYQPLNSHQLVTYGPDDREED
jgi:hypothetical protein